MVDKQFQNIKEGRTRQNGDVFIVEGGTFLAILPTKRGFYAYLIYTNGSGKRYSVPLIALNSDPPSFNTQGDFSNTDIQFYNATQQEEEWIKECIQVNGLVPMPQVNKLYPIF